jgi:hypothetical protein
MLTNYSKYIRINKMNTHLCLLIKPNRFIGNIYFQRSLCKTDKKNHIPPGLTPPGYSF